MNPDFLDTAFFHGNLNLAHISVNDLLKIKCWSFISYWHLSGEFYSTDRGCLLLEAWECYPWWGWCRESRRYRVNHASERWMPTCGGVKEPNLSVEHCFLAYEEWPLNSFALHAPATTFVQLLSVQEHVVTNALIINSFNLLYQTWFPVRAECLLNFAQNEDTWWVNERQH